MSAAASAAANEASIPTTRLERALITVSVMLTAVLQVLDMTIANIALPHMQGSLSATQEQISWVLTSYIVATAIMTAPTGVLAALIGRKRLFLVAVAGFTLASMLCGAATSLPEMVLLRVAQGAFGACLVPLSQSVLLDTYPPAQHGWAMAIWGIGVMVGPILGPTLGGYLTETYNWRWVFYINLPFGILAMLGILASVPETRRDPGRGFDVFGFVLLSLAIGAFQLMLDRGESQDWFASTEIVIEAVLAALCAYMFLVHMFTAERPFVEPGLFTDRNFAVGIVLIFLISVVLLSTVVLLPPFLQNLLGYPVLTAGLMMVPRGAGTVVAMVLYGRLLGGTDARWLVLFGLVLMAFSLWQMSGFDMNVDAWTIVYTGILQGFGLGFIYSLLSTMSFGTLALRYRIEGAAMFSLTRNLGGSIGISIVVALLAESIQVNHSVLGESITPFRDMLQRPWLPEAWDWATTAGLMALDREIVRQATTIAFANDFLFIMWATLAAVPLLLLLRPQRRDAAAPRAAPE